VNVRIFFVSEWIATLSRRKKEGKFRREDFFHLARMEEGKNSAGIRRKKEEEEDIDEDNNVLWLVERTTS
jgi:hypothetical protein